MSAKLDQEELRFFRRWTVATSAGWLLGFVFTLAGAILADIAGVEDAQFFVGIGMGTGIGYGQLRWAGPRFGATNRWVAASAVGMGTPFVASDVVHAVWSQWSFSLPLSVALGGLLVGFLEGRLLRSHSRRANWWVPACIAGWTLAAATVGLSSLFLPGGWLALFSLGTILLGGVVLAAVTGGALVWLLRSSPAV
jgi:hypothetical protein